MLDDFEYLYDAATAAAIGRRDLQEDAIATHFPAGSGLGYIVLAGLVGFALWRNAAERLLASAT